MAASHSLFAFHLPEPKRPRPVVLAGVPPISDGRTAVEVAEPEEGRLTAVAEDQASPGSDDQRFEDGSGREVIVLEPGALIPGTRYRVIRPLDDGAMGEVFEAEHVDIERRVALKVLRAEACSTPRIVELFREEARAASRIGAEGIAEVYDFAELPDGRLMFAMELLSGPTIGQALEAGRMQSERVIGILRQICKALAAAHRAHIIHRDIKPDNIVLETRRDRADTVKLVDFGVATMMDDALQPQPVVVGTPHYLAPEAVLGRPYDGRLDVYAVGCTAYEMLTGTPPFDADDPAEILAAHVEQPPADLSYLCPQAAIPEALEQVIMKCLAKDPTHRFADMADLEAALCEAQLVAELTTAWDDLPLPEVDTYRHEYLSQYLPRSPGGRVIHARRSARLGRWGLTMVATVGAVLIGLAGMDGWSQTTEAGQAVASSSVHSDTSVKAIVDAARGAAAKNYFVFPPATDTDQTTAFREVLALEGMARPWAHQKAGELRQDFAETLVRLGDRFWLQPGGKRFAAQYYAQALMFDPDHDRAVRRSNLAEDELQLLRDRVADERFTKQDLRRSDSLGDLTAAVRQDGDPPLRALEALQRAEPDARATPQDADGGDDGNDGHDDDEVEGVTAESDDGAESRARRNRVAERRSARRRARARRRAAAAEEAGSDDAGEPSDPRRDAGRARQLLEQAKVARRRGQVHRADTLLDRALAEDRRHVPALLELSDLHFNQGRYSKAARHAKRAVALAPDSPTARVRLGDAYFKVLRYEDALGEYRRAAALGHTGAKLRMKRAQSKLGEP